MGNMSGYPFSHDMAHIKWKQLANHLDKHVYKRTLNISEKWASILGLLPYMIWDIIKVIYTKWSINGWMSRNALHCPVQKYSKILLLKLPKITTNSLLTLLHSDWTKLHWLLAILRTIGLAWNLIIPQYLPLQTS